MLRLLALTAWCPKRAIPRPRADFREWLGLPKAAVRPRLGKRLLIAESRHMGSAEKRRGQQRHEKDHHQRNHANDHPCRATSFWPLVPGQAEIERTEVAKDEQGNKPK